MPEPRFGVALLHLKNCGILTMLHTKTPPVIKRGFILKLKE